MFRSKVVLPNVTGASCIALAQGLPSTQPNVEGHKERVGSPTAYPEDTHQFVIRYQLREASALSDSGNAGLIVLHRLLK
jgi:hypothetical protein